MKIVFFGTPDFAVASLEALLANQHKVLAVVTAPDKPAGRGMQLQISDVKKCAIEHQLLVLQPEKLRDPLFISSLNQLQADLFVVVAFRMLPEVVWNMPPLGSINVHASLLPNYRGAAPIHWAIIHGEKITGVTTFKLQHEIDTGHILKQKEVAILPEDNVGSMYTKLMYEGANLLIETLKEIEANTITEIPQLALENTHHAPKITKAISEINWNQPALKILNLIRGLSPMPAAFTFLQQKRLKIYSASILESNTMASPGTVNSDQKTFIKIACQDAWLLLGEVQLEGKKRMSVEDFLKGNTIELI
ncbi:MAG: methionyl-tRNA formyltransferase [Chitinophagaceae bacterium]